VFPIIDAIQRGSRRVRYYVAIASVAAVGVTLIFNSALAQDTVPRTDSVVLPQIVVSPTTIATPSNEVASSVTVITSTDSCFRLAKHYGQQSACPQSQPDSHIHE